MKQGTGKLILVSSIIILLLAVVTFSVMRLAPRFNIINKPDNSKLSRSELAPDIMYTDKASQKQGIYTPYLEDSIEVSGYSTNIIFFFAPWCPECQAFKEAIQSGSIPDGVQILEADYDSSTDLKKKYGVTLQSTFVKVDSSGTAQKKWVGYGKDKSLNSVLTNLR